jgi:hypothetical protein
MRGLRSLALVAPALMLAMALSVGTALADNGGRPFSLALSGANEFNDAGQPINPHGNADRGSARLTINPGQEEVCWTFGAITLTAGEALPHVAHIHRAPPGVAGPVVVDIFGTATSAPAPTSYPTGTTCVHGDRDVLTAILRDPGAYYLNLHNAEHPGGVMRAQLG